MSADQVVKTYKSLANLECNCFQHMKTVDIEIRPIRHRLVCRVHRHAFSCMLGAHPSWHLRRAWPPFTFTDETAPERTDLGTPAKLSAVTSSVSIR